MARQNGIVLLPVAATVLGLVAARHVPRKTALAYGAGFLLLTGALMFEANAILAAHGDHGSGARVELRIAQSYDLAGALKRQPALVLIPLDKSAPALARLLRQRGVPRYSTHRLDPIMNDEPTADAIHAAPRGVIFATWRDLVLHHPALYLAMRWPVFWQVLAEPRACTMIYTGIDGPAEEMKELGIAPQHSRRAWLLGYYAGRLMDMGVLSHLPFLALAAGLLVVLLRRREPADLAVAGLLAGALLFTFTFLVVSLACDYRYIYFLDLAAMAGALYVARGALRN
jgi:hypothetical protein